MASGIRWTACVISCLALAGCGANDLMVKRQTETEARLEQLLQSDKKNGQRLNELADRFRALDDQAKAVAIQVQEQQGIIRELRNTQDELKARIVLLTRQAAIPKVEVVNRPQAPETGESGPPADYVKAFGFYSANNCSAAIEAFDSFIKGNPGSEYAGNASYWIGECRYSMSDLPGALDSFQRAVDAYPKSSKTPDALLKLGDTLAAMKNEEKAAAMYERVIRTYPGSPAAAKARERLTAH